MPSHLESLQKSSSPAFLNRRGVLVESLRAAVCSPRHLFQEQSLTLDEGVVYCEISVLYCLVLILKRCLQLLFFSFKLELILLWHNFNTCRFRIDLSICHVCWCVENVVVGFKPRCWWLWATRGCHSQLFQRSVVPLLTDSSPGHQAANASSLSV